jgi:O-antigen/teichoic acid export membrane protein
MWQRLGTLACAAAALVWRPNVVALGVAMLLPAVATFVYSARRAAQLGRSAAVHDKGVDPATPMRTEAALARDVIPIGIGVVLSALYFRIDVFLVEIWSGTGSVALYSAVFRLVEALRLFPAAVLAVTLPALCRSTGARPLLQVSAAITIFGAVVSLVLMTVAGWLVPFIYGDHYAEAVPAFRILLAAFPLMSLNYALTHQLIGWNGHRSYAVICAAALVFNVALNTRLIPELAIVGAAWSTLWTEALLTLGCAAALRGGLARPQASMPGLAPAAVPSSGYGKPQRFSAPS